MADLTVQNGGLSGLVLDTVDTAAAAGGDTFTNTGNTLFYVNNGGGTSVTVTFTAQSTNVSKAGYGNVSIADTTVSVAAGATTLIGTFPTARFNNSSGKVAVSYSGVTSVTVAAIEQAPSK